MKVVKWILRILKWVSVTVLGLVLILVLLLALDRDATPVSMTEAEKAAIRSTKEFSLAQDSSRYQELMGEYGRNKKLAPGYELQCLLALSHYPELRDAKIEFRLAPTFLPLASRPEPISVLLPWVKRNYLVVISSESADFFEDILMHNLPFNEQVGVVGHELAHTLYYQDKNSFSLAWLAYRYEYGGNEVVTPFERDTDKRAVAHGLGYQLIDYAYFVRRKFGMSEEEIAAEEGDTYLSPKELVAEMEKYPFYEENL